MWFIVLRMLSSASLSAFSAAVQARARGEAPLGAIMPVRGQTDSRPGMATREGPGTAVAPMPARPPVDRTLPRGSLLDLSV